MSLGHERWRRRVSLLASGCLDDPERARTLAHLESCDGCRRDHAAARALLEAVAEDAARRAEPKLAFAALVGRVEARIAGQAPPRTRPWLWALAGLGAVAAVLVLVPHLAAPVRPPAAPPPAAEAAFVSAEALQRLERNAARQRAARYLNEAQDVLMTLTALRPDCERRPRRVDIGDEVARSQELLARRALLVEVDHEEVASARPVLDDVELVLREVAALQACARAGEIETLKRQMDRRRLLMKIRLMSRELQG